MSQVVKI